jgi:hypothetical protein
MSLFFDPVLEKTSVLENEKAVARRPYVASMGG